MRRTTGTIGVAALLAVPLIASLPLFAAWEVDTLIYGLTAGGRFVLQVVRIFVW